VQRKCGRPRSKPDYGEVILRHVGEPRCCGGLCKTALRQSVEGSLLEPADEAVDGVPGFAGDDELALLDIVRLQFNVCRNSVHRHHEPDDVGRSLDAARFALNGLEGDTRAVKLFAHVSRDFELTFVKCSERHVSCFFRLSNFTNASPGPTALPPVPPFRRLGAFGCRRNADTV
jgi:hypothetical protein